MIELITTRKAIHEGSRLRVQTCEECNKTNLPLLEGWWEHKGVTARRKGKKEHVNQACDGGKIRQVCGEEKTIYWEYQLKNDLQIREPNWDIMRSGFLDCMFFREVGGGGSLFTVCLGTIHAAVTATYVSNTLILVPKKLSESSQNGMYESKPEK